MKKLILLIIVIVALSFTHSIAQVIAAGNSHSIAVCINGDVKGWGTNSSGSLGNDSIGGDFCFPDSTRISGVKAVSAGFDFSIVLKNDSTVWAFGANSTGTIGNGDTTYAHVSHPVQVVGLSEVVSVAAGFQFAMALKKDGTVWAWGRNASGELGNGSTTNSVVPIQVTSLTGIVKIAAGAEQGVALKGDGTVWTWGSNQFGGLGVGDLNNRYTPVLVSSISGIVDIACHYGYYVLALKNDGTVWSWGQNQFGQLGIGPSSYRMSPVLINTLSGISKIFAGQIFSYFIRSDGVMYAAGYGYEGQLANGDVGYWVFPQLCTEISGVKEVAGGYGHVLFLKFDGTVWGAGPNDHGALCTGNFNPSTTVVPAVGVCYINPYVNSANFNHYAHGYVYSDSINNCIRESTERGLPFLPVIATPGNYYTSSDDTGFYSLGLDGPGSYDISPLVNQTYSSLVTNPCPANRPISILTTSSHDTSGFNFGFDVSPCWLLNVNVGCNRKRRCMSSTTTVKYWNYGLVAATNAEVHVKFAEYDIPVSASLPYTIDVDSSLVFNIGTLQPWQSGSITIIDSIACIPGIAGLTQCTKTWILPANDCLIDSTTGPGWDHSSTQVSGTCVNDTCRFVILNHGSGNMTSPQPYRIYADNVLMFTGSYQLASGDSLVVLWVSGGATIRLEADQHPDHPGHSHPRATLEGCGDDGSGNFTIGEVNRAPMDDEDVDVEIDCMQIRDSYDPNEKDNAPEGIDTAHLVLSNTPIDFTIHFQNTGTDTAYKVVVIDSLSNDLDLATLELGAASHAYTTSLSGQGVAVLKFTFNNINLIDSITDELNSHGFIKYKISPKASTPLGTRINNAADIYFDFNFPIRTNTAFVTLGDYLTTSVNDSKVNKSGFISIYPNPATESFTLQCNMAGADLNITDVTGRTVLMQKISSQSTIINYPFAAGIYFVRVSDGEKVFTRKVVIE